MPDNSSSNIPSATPAPPEEPLSEAQRLHRRLIMLLNLAVIVVSVILIVWISIDTFEKKPFLNDHSYMTFQLWVCIFFLADFFVELAYSKRKWRFFAHRLLFFLLSIPYLNIINLMHIELGADALYFIRFIPLARGALAMSIVIGYLSSNAVTSMFMSYLSIMVLVGYFCSLIFFSREYGVNPQVQSYWSALWWTAMNMTTVGCDISPVTVSGKIVAVVCPLCGMIVFPLFTVYLTNYVTNAVAKHRQDRDSASF